MTTFNLNDYLEHPRSVTTKSGRRVRIVCTNMRNSCYPQQCVVAIVEDENGSEDVETYDIYGRYRDDGGPSACDLVFPDDGECCWINIHRSSDGRVYSSSLFTSEADAARRANRPDFVKTVKIAL